MWSSRRLVVECWRVEVNWSNYEFAAAAAAAADDDTLATREQWSILVKFLSYSPLVWWIDVGAVAVVEMTRHWSVYAL